MKAQLYKITAVTNLQAGSGETNYSVVDNLVQRDPATGIPCIHGSSIKGAIKEFIRHVWKNEDSKLMTEIFGDDGQPSNYRFISAQLLAIPMRSNEQNYFLATCPRILLDAYNMANRIGQNIDLKGMVDQKGTVLVKPQNNRPILFRPINDDLYIEDFEDFEFNKFEGEIATNAIGMLQDIVILSDADFMMMTNNNHLPVIARNRMDGERNLWYEQVLPRESIMVSSIFRMNDDHWSKFNKTIAEDDNLIHIGANATVGYGFTKFQVI